jgi:hypothetical protein
MRSAIIELERLFCALEEKEAELPCWMFEFGFMSAFTRAVQFPRFEIVMQVIHDATGSQSSKFC